MSLSSSCLIPVESNIPIVFAARKFSSGEDDPQPATAGQEARGSPFGSRITLTSGGIESSGDGRGASTRSLPRAAGTSFDRVSQRSVPSAVKKRARRPSPTTPLESAAGASRTIQRYPGKIRTEWVITSWRGQDARRIGAGARAGNTYRDSVPSGASTRTAGQSGAAPPDPVPRSRLTAAFQASGPTPASNAWGTGPGRPADGRADGVARGAEAGAAPTITIAPRSATMMRDVTRPRYLWVAVVELDAAGGALAFDFLAAGLRAGAGAFSVRSRATQRSSLLSVTVA